VPLVIFLIGVRLIVAGNQRGYLLIIFAIGVAVAIEWNSKAQQNYQAAINTLQSAGFTVDEQLPSQPPVVFDHSQQQMAFIKLDEAKVYHYNDVQKVAWLTTKNTGWTNKSAPEKSYSVIFYLQDGAQFSVRMAKAGETFIKAWQGKLGPPINF
jgi:hypothetical protein